VTTVLNNDVQAAVEAALAGRKTVMLCPAHDDASPSLSVGPGTSQPVVLHCHTGCTQAEIIAAAGLDWDAVCQPREDGELDDRSMWTPRGTASHIYPYVLGNGMLAFEVLRVPQPGGKKTFMQRQPDATAPHGHKWNLDGVQRVLYRLPQVLAAVADGRTIHVAEGEKCVHALLRVIGAGEAATCNPGGAGKWQAEFSQALAGATVVIYSDADDTGQKHAREVRESLVEHGCTVKIVEAPSGVTTEGKPINDVADHIEAGRTLEMLLETTPEMADERARTGVDVLDLILRPRDKVEYVIDNTLAKGERLILLGFEGTGKSTLCRQIAVMVAAGIHPFTHQPMEPRKVLFVDAENHPEQTLDSWNQMVGLAARHEHPVERGMLTVLEEWESDRDLCVPSGSDWLHERVFAYQPDLVVMGPLTNLAGRDLRDDEPVRKIKNAVTLARSICNSAFIMEHHAPHKGPLDKERPLRPYGSSLFIKWPDYGYGIKPTEDERIFEWHKNRGPRVRTRRWPDGLREGAANSIEWPWMPVIQDEEGKWHG
jgi:5S rRNA maturation endonuclease (ribonuclease M5)